MLLLRVEHEGHWMLARFGRAGSVSDRSRADDLGRELGLGQLAALAAQAEREAEDVDGPRIESAFVEVDPQLIGAVLLLRHPEDELLPETPVPIGRLGIAAPRLPGRIA